jgi:hypothetical protein
MINVTGNFFDDKKAAIAHGLNVPTVCSKAVLYGMIESYKSTQAIAKPVLLKDKPARPVVATMPPVKRVAIVTPGMAWARKPAKPIKRSKA